MDSNQCNTSTGPRNGETTHRGPGQSGEAAAAGGPLGSSQSKSAHGGNESGYDRLNERRYAWAARAVLWGASTRRTVRMCGSQIRPRKYVGSNGGAGFTDLFPNVPVMLSGKPGEAGATAGYGSLIVCGSVWSCPRCAGVIASKRVQQMQNALSYWLKTPGHSAYLTTLTMRHGAKDSLVKIWDALSDARRGVYSGAAWRGNVKTGLVGDKAMFGVAGVHTTVEVTFGDPREQRADGSKGKGWHVHTHTLVFTDRELTEAEEESFRVRIFGRWSGRLKKTMGKTPLLDDGGADVRKINREKDPKAMSEYLFKHQYRGDLRGASWEAVGGAVAKSAKKGNRTPFQMLAELVGDAATRKFRFKTPNKWEVEPIGDAGFLKGFDLINTGDGSVEAIVPNGEAFAWRRWHEWENASSGRRQSVWSKRYANPQTATEGHWNAMLDARGEEAELGEEKLAEEEVSGEEIAQILRSGWFSKMVWQPSLMSELLEAAEARGLAGLAEACESHGIDFVQVLDGAVVEEVLSAEQEEEAIKLRKADRSARQGKWVISNADDHPYAQKGPYRADEFPLRDVESPSMDAEGEAA